MRTPSEILEGQEILPVCLRDLWRFIGYMKQSGRSLVIEVENLKSRERAVLKHPYDIGDKRSLARFKLDLDILSKSTHEGIAPILASGSDGDLPYYITPKGITLTEYWTSVRNRDIPAVDLFKQSIAIIRSINCALIYCQNQTPPIVHRDIKQDNVIFLNNDFSCPRLIDFGIAYVENDIRLTETEETTGNQQSKPPEAFYRRIYAPGPWWDVRGLFYLWVWMLTNGPKNAGHWTFRYHQFVNGLDWREPQLRALWASIEAELGPNDAIQFEDYLKSAFETSTSYTPSEKRVFQALSLERSEKAVREIRDAELTLATSRLKVAVSPLLTSLLNGFCKIVDRLEAQGLRVENLTCCWENRANGPSQQDVEDYIAKGTSPQRLPHSPNLLRVDRIRLSGKKFYILIGGGVYKDPSNENSFIYILTLSTNMIRPELPFHGPRINEVTFTLSPSGKWRLTQSWINGPTEDTDIENSVLFNLFEAWLTDTPLE